MSRLGALRRVGVVAGLIFLSGVFTGCKDSGSDPAAAAEPGTFDSDLPASAGDGEGRSRGDSDDESGAAPEAPGSAAGAPGANDNAAGSDGGEAARAIVEADVIQVSGDRLYALSRIAGLAVVDVADPAQLRLLGGYRELSGTPFEMYLRGDVAILMFSGWGEYVATDDGAYNYVQTSKIVALDVRNPAAIQTVGSFDVPGSIQDSRVVGDVLYVVGTEDGYCYGCDSGKPATTISSLDVRDARTMTKVDELRYVDASDSYSWQRSIAVTDQRMYVAGPEYGNDGPVGSSIQVVDISDRGGKLVPGAVIQARGQVSNRWQMDEFEGVFRVVSQPFDWRATNDRPSVQTFQVVSSQEFHALGRTEIVIPARETLRSTRFDGTRAYVITAEQKDPLFTLDLSDPANPRQVGELEMPGFVYHMEPRGERLLGLGFDQGNPEGSITVSLFDVSDLAQPTMLSRVNFGGNWGSLPEDQDRIHKVFRVLTELNLILVPFSGWEQSGDEENYCGGKSIGGVQLVDFFADSDRLALRGAASTQGQSRRALIHGDHLLSVSDERVESFDIADRSEPSAAGQLILSAQVVDAKQLDGGIVARVTTDYNRGSNSVIELVGADQAADPNQSLGRVDLGAVIDPEPNTEECQSSWYIQSLHAQGSRLFVYYEQYASKRDGTGEQRRGVVAVNAADPANPVVESPISWSSTDWSSYYDYFSYGSFALQNGELWHGSLLALLEQRYEYIENSNQEPKSYVRLRLVDLSDPAAPSTSTLDLTSGRSYSGLIADGDRLLTSHFESARDAASGRARFYVDAFDVSDPNAPRALEPINVPGALVHYDSASRHALTSQLTRVPAGNTTPDECYQRFAVAEFEYPQQPGAGDTVTGRCVGYEQSLHLVDLRDDGAVLEDTLTLDEDENVGSWSSGDGVVFATLGRGGYYGRRGGFGVPEGDIACAGPCGPSATPKPVELLTLGGFGTGALAVGRLTVESDSDPWWGFWGTPPVYAYGTSALLISQQDVAIVDASDATAPQIARTEALLGSYVQSVDVREQRALLSLGERGVQFVDL